MVSCFIYFDTGQVVVGAYYSVFHIPVCEVQLVSAAVFSVCLHFQSGSDVFVTNVP